MTVDDHQRRGYTHEVIGSYEVSGTVGGSIDRKHEQNRNNIFDRRHDFIASSKISEFSHFVVKKFGRGLYGVAILELLGERVPG